MVMKRVWALGDPPTIEAEERFWRQGLVTVAGLDEAGRGPWAGPVWAGAVVLPEMVGIPESLVGVRDSKVLTMQRREVLVERIRDVALAVGDGSASAGEIDALGIVSATRLAMQRAIEALGMMPQALILDAITLPHVALPQDSFPSADARSIMVAAASIIAKVLRDRWMVEHAEVQYPGYGFAQHKGYGTRQHQEALDRLGVCPLHRRSFQPIASRLDHA